MLQIGNYTAKVAKPHIILLKTKSRGMLKFQVYCVSVHYKNKNPYMDG